MLLLFARVGCQGVACILHSCAVDNVFCMLSGSCYLFARVSVLLCC